MFQTRDMHCFAIQSFPRAWCSIPKRYRTLEFLRELLDTQQENIISFFQRGLPGYDPFYKHITCELAARGYGISETV